VRSRDRPSFDPALLVRRRYAFALSIVAILSLASQVVIQSTLARNDDDSRVVNIAGRQRMLSQKIAKAARAIVDARSPAGRRIYAVELGEATELLKVSHDALLRGDSRLGVDGRNSATVLRLFEKIEPQYEAILGAALSLQREALDAAAARPRLAGLAGPILADENDFLQGMNAVTFQYDAETKERLQFIGTLEYVFFALTGLTLTLEALFIFRPAERQIRTYFGELDRIRQDLLGTNDQLATMNRSLGAEIAERARAEERERASAREKEILLKELQHRVKNSISVIASLVGLEGAKAEAAETRAILAKLESRIEALASLYDMLYATGSFEGIVLPDYLGRVVDSAAKILGADARNVRISCDIAPVRIDARRAISIGLIVNELVTDSMKYAFPDRAGNIDVRLVRNDEDLVLEIRDDGIGLPPGFPEPGSSGSGLIIVQALAKQLAASFEARSDAGARFSLAIPLEASRSE